MGWSLYQVARLPGQGTLEMQCTSGKFEAELFSMTNATAFEADDQYEVFATERHTIAANVITLDHVVVDDPDHAGDYAISIPGLTQANTAETVASGTYKVTISGSTCTVTFNAEETGEVEVSYKYAKSGARVAKMDNRAAAIGEAMLLYPVYNDGSDCTDSGISGYVMMRIYRARVTAAPGLDGSYKTASTFGFTLTAMDPKRNDEKVYEVAYVKGDEF